MLQLRPNFADAWSNLASAYMRNGRLSEATQCCRQALALNHRLVIDVSNPGHNFFKLVGAHLNTFFWLFAYSAGRCP